MLVISIFLIFAFSINPTLPLFHKSDQRLTA